jgi:hypothetical protein
VDWRTKVSGAPAVEHPSRAAAEAAIADMRRRYHAGARSFRVVRLLDPEGGLQLIDFAREDREAAGALREVQRATEASEQALRAAQERWEAAITRAVVLGQEAAAIAEAAGTTAREVRSIARRRIPNA